MSNLLDAVNVSASINSGNFLVGSLPANKGDVSIMTLRQLYVALGGSISSLGSKYDPTRGYNSSTYYVYGIVGFNGNNSTSNNLRDVDFNWYKQKHKATLYDLTFSVGRQTLFGGPLTRVEHTGDNMYSFTWYYSEDNDGYPSSNGYYWNAWVPGFVEVVVMRATDAIMSEEGPLPITSSLPSRPGDISIMTIEQAYIALSDLTNPRAAHCDPTKGYSTSTYFIYAINDAEGNDDSRDKSIPSNLQGVGIDWYTKLNKPTVAGNHWTVGEHKVFGGPLMGVRRISEKKRCSYSLYWYYSETGDDRSSENYYWRSVAHGSVYVAIVRR